MTIDGESVVLIKVKKSLKTGEVLEEIILRPVEQTPEDYNRSLVSIYTDHFRRQLDAGLKREEVKN